MENREYWCRANQILEKIDNDEFLLLKGHLLIEELINRRVSYFIDEVHFRRLNLSFIKKVDLLCGLKSINSEGGFIELIRDLNKIRNKIAHDLDYDIKNDVILFIKKGYGDTLPKTINRKATYLNGIKKILYFILGYLAGLNEAHEIFNNKS